LSHINESDSDSSISRMDEGPFIEPIFVTFIAPVGFANSRTPFRHWFLRSPYAKVAS